MVMLQPLYMFILNDEQMVFNYLTL